ncbi:pentapeptide repeat protein [Edaphobacter aggregans]|uniref:Pentapeptide repeat protein n=1 Tax=Edaphobacter aggregans TaxID=570835 RepID=A0A428MGB3_9BACT|nr:pentapeptide repeat-containing protein [Edaphobacter aggregans]RSL15753.1 pentapeptide repeat protein [Edaphobacter aggregans]
MPESPQDQTNEPVSSADLSANKLRAEIRNLDASTKKIKWEAANAKAQNNEVKRKRSFYERILSTTQATIVLALITLMFQIVQFGYTARQGRLADESKQWKDAVKEVSFDGDSKAVGGAMVLETFFSSDLHSGEAKTLVAVTLPFIKDVNAFDHLFEQLRRRDGWADPCCLIYSVAQSISLSHRELAKSIYKDAKLPIPSQGLFRINLSSEIEKLTPEASLKIEEARRREWQIDTVTQGLLDFWRENGTRPPQADSADPPYSADLRTLILRLDEDAVVNLSGKNFTHVYFKGAYLHNVNFSDSDLSGGNLSDVDMGSAQLRGTRLDGVVVHGADFDNVTDVEGSSWKGVRWWEAARLSNKLCQWFPEHGEKPESPDQYLRLCGSPTGH